MKDSGAVLDEWPCLFWGMMTGNAGDSEIVVDGKPAVGLKVLNADLVDIIDSFLDQVRQYQFGTVTIAVEKGRVCRVTWAPSVKLKTSV